MLNGKLVKLRPIAASDLPIMRCWFADPAVMRFWANSRPFVTEHTFESDLGGSFARFDDAGYFTILDPDSKPIGRIDFEHLDTRTRSVELGILIGEVSAQGKGYGPDAIIALLGYLYFNRNVHRVELTVLEFNEYAIRAYERIGFVHEGTLRDYRYVDGAYVAEHQMSILRPEFETRYSECSAN